MLPLPIIHRTHVMLFFHPDVERMNLLLLIFLISHIIFLNTLSVKFIVFHLPLFVIHQIMRMPLYVILNFLIMVVVTSSLIHLVTIQIFLLLIFPNYRSVMIYLLMSWNILKMLSHFSPIWWLCQVLVVLRLVLLSIRIVLNLLRLLITLSHILKINLCYNFCILHLYHMIVLLSHWRNCTWWALLQNINFHLSSCLLIFQVRNFVPACLRLTMCLDTIVHLQSAFHVLSIFTFLQVHSSFEHSSLYCLIFLVY